MRTNIFKVVHSPLGFFTLVVLIAQANLGAIAVWVNGPDFTLLLVSMVAIIFLLILIAAYIAYRQPEALIGVRPAAPARPCPNCRPGSGEGNRPT